MPVTDEERKWLVGIQDYDIDEDGNEYGVGNMSLRGPFGNFEEAKAVYDDFCAGMKVWLFVTDDGMEWRVSQ